MSRSGVLLGVASVLAGTAVLMAVLGIAYNLVFVVMALPFGVAAYVLWFDATGKLAERTRRRAARGDGRGRRDRVREERARTDGARRTTREQVAPSTERPSRAEARRVLGVDDDADGAAIREAYREAVKDAHPDAEGGSEEEFKRVRAAYDRLRE